MAETNTEPAPYFSVSTIEVEPGKMSEVGPRTGLCGFLRSR